MFDLLRTKLVTRDRNAEPAFRCATLVITALAVGATAEPAFSTQQAAQIELRPANAVLEHAFSLGRVTSVRELSDGSLLIGDGADEHLVHVRWGTREVTPIGRAGDGPGEYRGVGWLYPLGADSTLFSDSYTGRWLILDGLRMVSTIPEGSALNRLLGGELSGADRRGNVLGVTGATSSAGSRLPRHWADSLILLLARPGFDRVDTIAHLKGRGVSQLTELPRPTGSGPRVVVLGNPLEAEDQALLFPDGWIAVARLDPYRVDWRTPEGRWIRGAPLPFDRRRVTDGEKCWATTRMLGQLRPCTADLPGWPDVLPPFLLHGPLRAEPALLASPDGRLVIGRTPTEVSPESRYDLVDRTGRLAAVLVLPPNEGLIGFGTRSVYVLASDDDQLVTLRRHQWP